jgi:hypothetical protein
MRLFGQFHKNCSEKYAVAISWPYRTAAMRAVSVKSVTINAQTREGEGSLCDPNKP